MCLGRRSVEGRDVSKSHVGESLGVGITPRVACADGLGSRRRGRRLLVNHPGPSRSNRANGVGTRVCCAGDARLIKLLVLRADLGEQQRSMLANRRAGARRRGEARACGLCY